MKNKNIYTKKKKNIALLNLIYKVYFRKLLTLKYFLCVFFFL